jgi:PAS domain S-box-containing protein
VHQSSIKLRIFHDVVGPFRWQAHLFPIDGSLSAHFGRAVSNKILTYFLTRKAHRGPLKQIRLQDFVSQVGLARCALMRTGANPQSQVYLTLALSIRRASLCGETITVVKERESRRVLSEDLAGDVSIGEANALWVAADLPTDEALSVTLASLKVLMDLMPQMVWSTQPDGFHDYYNARWYEFTGVPLGSTDGEGWNGMFHPEDQESAWERWRRSLATGAPYEIEYRLRRHDGTYRWTLGRAMPVRGDDGNISRWIGTCTDIDDSKRAAEQNELLSAELSHRIKNIFAVVAGLISLTGRNNPEIRPLTHSLQDRIAALGRAHEFARPHSEDSVSTSKPESTLMGLLMTLMRPYPAFDDGKICIHGDDVALDDGSATPIALAFHEMATNAAKYGALSAPEGHVDIELRHNADTLSIHWKERGGPEITGPPQHEGFGSRLARLSIVRQMGGSLSYSWERKGLVVMLTVPTSSLQRLAQA